MDIDERKAMAIAALARVDDRAPDALLRAIAGAFAVVACADGELARAEIDRFVRFVHENEAFRGLPVGTLSRLFRDLCDAILTDFDAGRGGALAAVAALKGSSDARLVLHAAEVAVLADDKLRSVEKVALALVAATLGLELDGEWRGRVTTH